MLRFKSVLLLIILVTQNSLGQESAPPSIEGNEGLPGALEQIEMLSSELAQTLDELALTGEALDATLTELSETKQVLEATEEELADEKQKYRVPQTGQTNCWQAPTLLPDSPHATTSCVATGQDGELQAGIAPPADRFVNNGDGTLTDIFTDLVWTIRADCGDDLSWGQALVFASTLNGLPDTNECSLRDGSRAGSWRIPNVFELMSLVNYQEAYAIPEAFIDGGGFFWSSTTFAVRPDTPSNLAFPCADRGYGQDNFTRFNDVFVVGISSGSVIHVPKLQEDQITRRHYQLDNSCTLRGFENTGPDLIIAPRFLAVRDAP